MSAVTWPTNFLSMPWIVILVLSATVILISFGIENGTGWENPRLKLSVDPCTAALKPTPSISSCLVKPSLTPCTMLCTRLRESPCNAFTLRVSASRISETRLSFTLALMSRGSLQLSFPFGPSTKTAPSLSMLTFTLSGISTALFPIRDIKKLPNVGEQLAAHFLFLGFASRQHTARRRKNRHTHSAEHARDFVRTDVTAQTRTAHAPQAGDRARPVHDFVCHLDAWMRCGRVDRVFRDVTFVLQNADDLRLDLRVRNEHVDLLRMRRVADARQKIGNGISNSAHGDLDRMKKINKRMAKRASPLLQVKAFRTFCLFCPKFKRSAGWRASEPGR